MLVGEGYSSFSTTIFDTGRIRTAVFWNYDVYEPDK